MRTTTTFMERLAKQNWISPASLKMAMSDGYALPLVKVPGIGENPNARRAKRVLGVSPVSNRLEDKLKIEIMGSCRSVANVATSGFKLKAVSSYSGHDPFCIWLKYAEIEDPRGFSVSVSNYCYETLRERGLKPGDEIPGSYVYAWPDATERAIMNGTWIIPANSAIAKRARAFSDKAESKEAFLDVSELEPLKVYEAVCGARCGEKLAFLGTAKKWPLKLQARNTCSSIDKATKHVPPEKAIFAVVGGRIDGIPTSVCEISASDASKMFFRTSKPGSVPGDRLMAVAAIAKRAACDPAYNPADVSVASDLEAWKPLDASSFATQLMANPVGTSRRGSRQVAYIVAGRASKLPGKPLVELEAKLERCAASVVAYEVGQYYWSSTALLDSRSVKCPETQSGKTSALARLLAETASKLGLEQPDLGTCRKPAPEQLAWWAVWRQAKRDGFPSKYGDYVKIACFAGPVCAKRMNF